MVLVAARGSADQPGAAIVGDADAERQAEARDTKNTDADMNLNESAHNPRPVANHLRLDPCHQPTNLNPNPPSSRSWNFGEVIWS